MFECIPGQKVAGRDRHPRPRREVDMQLTANIYVTTTYRGANVGYITTDQGVVMVDSPMNFTDAVSWRREIEGKGQVKYLVNTESHVDHVAGNFFFDVPVIAQDKTREEMLALDREHILEYVLGIDPQGLHLVNDYQVRVPTIAFSHQLSLYLGRHSVHLTHLPGHTAGQTSVFIPEEKVVFTGDNVFCRTPTIIGGGDPFAWLESLERLGEFEVVHVVPGHGEVCDRSYLAEQASSIQRWLDTVQQAIDRGWSKAEAMDRIALIDPYPTPRGMGKVVQDMQRTGISYLYDRLRQRQL